MRDLLFVGLFALFLTNTHAADINDLTYDATGDTVIITDCAKDAAGDLVIPETIEGKPVTSIGGEAFRDCTSLTSITFGKNSKLTSIGEQAFRKCESLKSITIPDSVTSIGNMAFSGCRGLTSITIPDSVTSIEGGAFSSCSYLTSIKIPDSVTSIGQSAFSGCSRLTSITIPDSVTSIGVFAFYFCRSLTSINIPNSVINIERFAFSSCESLTHLKIGDKVNCIGRSAFANCNSLAWVTLGRGLINIKSNAFGSCRRLKSITIPENVTMIEDRAFSGASLNSITFESNKAPIIESSALDRSNMILYVPQGAIGYDSLRFRERHTIEWIKPKFEHVDCSIVKINGNEKKRLTFPIENGKKYFIQSSYDLSKWDYILGGISEPNNSAGDLKVVFDEQQQKKAHVPTEDIGKDWIQLKYDDLNWFNVESVSADGSLAGGGVGFALSGGRIDPFDPYIALDLEEQMHDTNASVYIRIPFIIDELSEIKSLILSARTDDGFVAWVNGEKVLSFNAPDVPHWNSEATASNPDRIATNLEDFSLDNYIDKLMVGENILAVQAMNRGKGGSDFLFSCFLRVPKKKFSIEYPLINPTNQNQLPSQFYRVISQ